MPREKVRSTVEGALGVITIDNPPHNLLGREVIREIERSLSELEGNGSVRVIILTGSGEYFSTGADIGEIAAVEEEASAKRMCVRGHSVFHRFWLARVPTIAALNGNCLGGGLEIALACHLRIAEEGIRLGFPEIRLGLIPGWGGTQRMLRYVGPSIALEYILTGRMMSAERAMELGIVNEVSPRGEALKEAKRLGRRIAEKSEKAVGEALKTIRNGLETSLEDALDHEAGCFGRLRATKEVEEGIRAFFEGRRPKFGG